MLRQITLHRSVAAVHPVTLHCTCFTRLVWCFHCKVLPLQVRWHLQFPFMFTCTLHYLLMLHYTAFRYVAWHYTAMRRISTQYASYSVSWHYVAILWHGRAGQGIHVFMYVIVANYVSMQVRTDACTCLCMYLCLCVCVGRCCRCADAQVGIQLLR